MHESRWKCYRRHSYQFQPVSSFLRESYLLDLSFTGPAGEVVAGSSENHRRACQLILYHSCVVSCHLMSTALSYFRSGRACYYHYGFVAPQDSILEQVIWKWDNRVRRCHKISDSWWEGMGSFCYHLKRWSIDAQLASLVVYVFGAQIGKHSSEMVLWVRGDPEFWFH